MKAALKLIAFGVVGAAVYNVAKKYLSFLP